MLSPPQESTAVVASESVGYESAESEDAGPESTALSASSGDSYTAIAVQGLGKRYRLGERYRSRYRTLGETLTEGVQRLLGIGGGRARRDRRGEEKKAQPEILWALRDIDFQVQRGEVVGIIGHNGAGKSTLLKILSRITAPTEGQVRLRGNLASLLEVGTGFHPELTGRENIFLNGSILGMRRQKIEEQFDAIVTFAEIADFIDTPVKHYSSGMYVRLAFAVAAHLDPDILVVDEILSVGDAAFQRKCLGKMKDVAGTGRTVIFVSHNMQAVQSLCTRAIQLHHGRLIKDGSPAEVVAHYLAISAETGSRMRWEADEAPGNAELRLLEIAVHDGEHSEEADDSGLVAHKSVFASRKDLFIDMIFDARTQHPALCVGFDLMSASGEVILRTYQTDEAEESWPSPQPGINRWRCHIPAGFLNAGRFFVSPRIGLHNLYWIVHLDSAVQFEVLLDHGISPLWSSLDQRSRPGSIAPILPWGAVLEAEAEEQGPSR
ncbi:MAG: ABC transporter ATP-binding protein [Acidobacteriota bacterium]